MNRRDTILEQARAIPALPAAALEAMRLLQDPDADAARMRKAVEHDPGLAASVLRLANSSRFGGARTVSCVRDAVVRLGRRNLLTLIMTATAAPVLSKPVKGYGLSAGGLWEHSVATAIATELLAAALKLGASSAAFTAGLLHDAGKLALGSVLEVDAKPVQDLVAREKIPFDEAERRVLGVDHAEVGAAMLDHWGLPEEICRAVRFHHQPEALKQPDAVTDLVHVCDALTLSEGIGTGADGLNYRLSAAAAGRLKLTARLEETVLSGVLSGLAEIKTIFGNG